MSIFSIGGALVLAIAIIAIGILYLATPWSAVRGFGLPLPEQGPNVTWWLRLKGVRDIASGLVVLGLLAWGGPRVAGIVLLIQAIIPVGDMSLILAAKGSTRSALGIHGATAMLMIVVAVSLIAGRA